MMQRILKIVSIIILSFCSVSVVCAEEISGLEVMQKVYDQSHIHHTQTASVFMTIVDKKDRKRERYFNLRNTPESLFHHNLVSYNR